MPRSTKKLDSQQTLLPLTREARLMSIDAAEPESLGIGVRSWRTIRELLRQIEFCSTRGGCFVRVEVLASRMGVVKRTVQRARRVAEEAGLLSVDDQRKGHNGQRSNEWQVNWCRLATHQPAQSMQTKVSPTPDEMSPPGDVVSPTPDEVSPRKENIRELHNSISFSKPEIRVSTTSLISKGTVSQKWREVELRLLRLGVLGATKAIALLQEHGLDSDHANALIDHYERSQGAWEPRQLFLRCSNARHGLPSDELWPEHSIEFQRKTTDVAKQQQQAQQLASRHVAASERKSNREHDDRLEAAHGADLDLLSKAELRELITENFKPGVSRMHLRALATKQKPTGFLRHELLSVLAKLREEESCRATTKIELPAEPAKELVTSSTTSPATPT